VTGLLDTSAVIAIAEGRSLRLPIEERAARCFGELVSSARQAGRRPGVAEALIAATAIAHGLPLYTCDDDFNGLPGLEIVRADEPVPADDPVRAGDPARSDEPG
jgi:predicted nucleic acid-binding protein